MRLHSQIRIHNSKAVVHQEAKTFSRRAAAEGELSLAALMGWYMENFQHISKWQRTKQAQLQFLEKHSIG